MERQHVKSKASYDQEASQTLLEDERNIRRVASGDYKAKFGTDYGALRIEIHTALLEALQDRREVHAK